jgi:hypothetical protein
MNSEPIRKYPFTLNADITKPNNAYWSGESEYDDV